QAVLVPGIVIQAPFPAPVSGGTSSVPTYSITLSALGTLSAAGTISATAFGSNPTVTNNDSPNITISGTLGEVERTLQTLTYKAVSVASGQTQQIHIVVRGGPFPPPPPITVYTGAPTGFDWNPTSGSTLFSDSGNWTT